MFFNQFLTRFIPPRTNEDNQKKAIKTKPIASATKEISPQSYFQASRNLNSTTEINSALKEVDKAIRSKTATHQQLLLKAEILLRKGRFRKAKELLTSICNNRKDQKIANEAKCLQKILPQLQQEASLSKLKTLVNDLRRIAQKYETKLLSLPSDKELTPDLDITLLIRKEAHLARSAELPAFSYELIEHTLQNGQESQWLVHDKALSLNMMGQQSMALELLRGLKKTTKKEKLTNSINRNIEDIQKNPKRYQLKANSYLAKQSKIILRRNGLDTAFIPEGPKINDKSRIKLFIFRKARAVLPENPKACLTLVNSILDYFQGDLAALLLKGEALAALQRNKEAIQIWKELTQSLDNTIARKAHKLITQHLTKKAKLISTKRSTKAALSYFIQEHLKLKLVPTLNNDIAKVISKLQLPNTNCSDPDLQNHQFQLQLNTLVVEFLENQLRQKDPLSFKGPTKNSVAIKEAVPKKS